jgi:hypothetical protein
MKDKNQDIRETLMDTVLSLIKEATEDVHVTPGDKIAAAKVLLSIATASKINFV